MAECKPIVKASPIKLPREDVNRVPEVPSEWIEEYDMKMRKKRQ